MKMCACGSWIDERDQTRCFPCRNANRGRAMYGGALTGCTAVPPPHDPDFSRERQLWSGLTDEQEAALADATQIRSRLENGLLKAQKVLADQEAELIRLRGKLAACRCGKGLE